MTIAIEPAGLQEYYPDSNCFSSLALIPRNYAKSSILEL